MAEDHNDCSDPFDYVATLIFVLWFGVVAGLIAAWFIT